MINKILTTIFCLSSLVCGTAEAKKKVEQVVKKLTAFFGDKLK
jgi:hypothetical protein